MVTVLLYKHFTISSIGRKPGAAHTSPFAPEQLKKQLTPPAPADGSPASYPGTLTGCGADGLPQAWAWREAFAPRLRGQLTAIELSEIFQPRQVVPRLLVARTRDAGGRRKPKACI